MNNISFNIPLVNSSHIFQTQEVSQYYGCLESGFPTGRPNDVKSIDIVSFIDYVKQLKRLNIEFNYLLNGRIKPENLSLFNSLYSRIFHEIEPDIITFSDPSVYHYIKSNFNFKTFEISTISGIKSARDFNKFIKECGIEVSDIRKLVLHHDSTRQEEERLFIDELKNNGIEPIVLVTESCYYECPFRKKHYNLISNSLNEPNRQFVDYCQIKCIIKRLTNPESLLDLSGFLLPEQISSFSYKTGITTFKLSGRSKSSDWVYTASNAYLSRSSPENLYDLIVFTSPYLSQFGMQVQDLFYLDSIEYSEIAFQLSTMDRRKRQKYLSLKASKLFMEGKLRINDPLSNYEVIEGRIRLIQQGEYLAYLKNVLSNQLQKPGVEDCFTFENSETI